MVLLYVEMVAHSLSKITTIVCITIVLDLDTLNTWKKVNVRRPSNGGKGSLITPHIRVPGVI